MRRKARTDDNQQQIVDALRKAGATVASLHQAGGGIPDLLVGFRGKNSLIEIKGKKGKLTKAQIEFFAKWRGKAYVCRTIDEALTAIEAI